MGPERPAGARLPDRHLPARPPYGERRRRVTAVVRSTRAGLRAAPGHSPLNQPGSRLPERGPRPPGGQRMITEADRGHAGSDCRSAPGAGREQPDDPGSYPLTGPTAATGVRDLRNRLHAASPPVAHRSKRRPTEFPIADSDRLGAGRMTQCTKRRSSILRMPSGASHALGGTRGGALG